MEEPRRWTGDRDGSPPAASTDHTTFGWRPLRQLAGSERDPEGDVVWTLLTDYGLDVERNGSRSESHDLTIRGIGPGSSFPRMVGMEPGKYEVKSLWRKSEGRTFDRRIKVGRRGERIYGRRDAAIKAFALAMEEQIDSIVDGQRDLAIEGAAPTGFPGGLSRFVVDVHEFLDAALGRRHSKSFDTRLRRLARASLMIPTLTLPAQRALTFEVHGTDILNGFIDIAGIFVVAGPMYTLVSQRELTDFFTFDSASVEGPRLRFLGKIPHEPQKSHVVRSTRNKVRKEQGSK